MFIRVASGNELGTPKPVESSATMFCGSLFSRWVNGRAFRKSQLVVVKHPQRFDENPRRDPFVGEKPPGYLRYGEGIVGDRFFLLSYDGLILNQDLIFDKIPGCISFLDSFGFLVTFSIVFWFKDDHDKLKTVVGYDFRNKRDSRVNFRRRTGLQRGRITGSVL